MGWLMQKQTKTWTKKWTSYDFFFWQKTSQIHNKNRQKYNQNNAKQCHFGTWNFQIQDTCHPICKTNKKSNSQKNLKTQRKKTKKFTLIKHYPKSPKHSATPRSPAASSSVSLRGRAASVCIVRRACLKLFWRFLLNWIRFWILFLTQKSKTKN